jgi:putative ABC transport system permease protein
VALGAGIAQFIGGINLGSTPIHAVVAPDSVLLATMFALAVGLFFGIYPAYRASSLNPIDALHYE